MTSPELIADAERQGYLAAYQLLSFEQNPHRSGDAQPGSQSFNLSAAWKVGFEVGSLQRDADMPFKE